MNTKSVLRSAALLILALGFATSASAGWTVTNLHPAGGWSSSVASGISGGQQVGYVDPGYNQYRAGMWSGTAGSFVNLHPASSTTSQAFGAGGGQQVGQSGSHAALWRGTAASWTDLNPAGMLQSSALGTDGTNQVGWSKLSTGQYHAGMWSGRSIDWVDLNPAGSAFSMAYAVSNGQQVGFTRTSHYGLSRAALWNGTAASWVNLGPAGQNSQAVDTDGTYQVGSIADQATLWRGTAASAVNLHPANTQASWATGVSGGYQVGYAVLGVYQETEEPYGYYEIDHAMLWQGTAASALDLHCMLGGSFENSIATDVQVVGRHMWISGYGAARNGVPKQAIIWHFDAVPEPSSLLALGSGLLALGGLIRRRR